MTKQRKIIIKPKPVYPDSRQMKMKPSMFAKGHDPRGNANRKV